MVTSVVILIAALTMPLGMRFFQIQTLDEATDGILETLRRAQAQAMFQKSDSAFGVKFLSGSYVLFQGNSYAGRTQSEDESFTLTGGIKTGGIDEITFAKVGGIPDITGVLIVTLGNDNQSININTQGMIEK